MRKWKDRWMITVWMDNSTSNAKSNKSFSMPRFWSLQPGRHSVIYYYFLSISYTFIWRVTAHVSSIWYNIFPQKRWPGKIKWSLNVWKEKNFIRNATIFNQSSFGMAGYFVLRPFGINSCLSLLSGISKLTAPAVHSPSLHWLMPNRWCK